MSRWQSEREKKSIRNSKIQILTLLFSVALVFMWAFWMDHQARQPQETEGAVWDTKCVVTRVVDGDTLECDGIPVRILEIDAPEVDWTTQRSMSQGPGYESQQALISILGQDRATVGLRFENRLADVYERLLAHVYLLDGTSVGDLMIQAGHATYRESY